MIDRQKLETILTRRFTNAATHRTPQAAVAADQARCACRSREPESPAT
jgi:hypothetical protein